MPPLQVEKSKQEDINFNNIIRSSKSYTQKKSIVINGNQWGLVTRLFGGVVNGSLMMNLSFVFLFAQLNSLFNYFYLLCISYQPIPQNNLPPQKCTLIYGKKEKKVRNICWIYAPEAI